MLPTLTETINNAALDGYDFENLASKIKNNKRGIQEYMYGYALAEDKRSYLESMAEDRVSDCDRIFLLKDKLGGYVKEVEKMPHTRIIKGFYKQKDEDHTEKYVSVYRIIILNDHAKTAIVRDLDYSSDGLFEGLSIWHAPLDYNYAANVLDRSGAEELLKIAGEVSETFIIDDHILAK